MILVGQVNREDCEIILNCQQPDKVGGGRMFISLDLEPLKKLRAEFEERGGAVRDGWWGYDTMIVEDPDGNALFFPIRRSGLGFALPADIVARVIRPTALSAIRVARRRARVSSRFALAIQWSTALR